MIDAEALAGSQSPNDTGPTMTAQAVSSTPSPKTSTPLTITVRARGDVAGGVWPTMTIRIDGTNIGSTSVTTSTFADYQFDATSLHGGAKVDVVFTNDGRSGSEDRNLYVAYVADAKQTILPQSAGVVYDRGQGNLAFDGVDTVTGTGSMYQAGALRLTWPSTSADPDLARKIDAARFLQQATFGPDMPTINELVNKSYSAWIDEQIAMPITADFVNYVQSKYAKGDAYRPKGSSYTPTWVGQKFWQTAQTGPDALRRKVAFSIHHIFMVSQADANLWMQGRAYANYLDTLNKNAFGNFRTLLQDMAMSPVMGIYLSHMRNRKEDLATGRVPDENFAREIMQLFTIGLHELNNDGTVKLDSQGNPIETYTNADVMALAKVFSGYSWAFPDSQLTEHNFIWGNPDTSAANDTGIDLLPMKVYPGQHSTAEKKLFVGKPWAATIPAGGNATEDLRLALNALYKHPNVGPFISRRMIQRLVTSNPSPAYVARVAQTFNNNGKSVRGDMGAVVKAILLDPEARNAPPAGFGMLREPVTRMVHWMRATGAKSRSGEYMMAWDLDTTSERALWSPTVFGYFRPGFVPPNTTFAASGTTMPEFQIVSESTVAAWINTAELMAGDGVGWNGSKADVYADYAPFAALIDNGNLNALLDRINLVFLAGRMSPTLRQSILDAAVGISSSNVNADLYRARAAIFLTMASPEFMVQK
jgi:uncharacterized protein (DUF1800 family)